MKPESKIRLCTVFFTLISILVSLSYWIYYIGTSVFLTAAGLIPVLITFFLLIVINIDMGEDRISSGTDIVHPLPIIIIISLISLFIYPFALHQIPGNKFLLFLPLIIFMSSFSFFYIIFFK